MAKIMIPTAQIHRSEFDIQFLLNEAVTLIQLKKIHKAIQLFLRALDTAATFEQIDDSSLKKLVDFQKLHPKTINAEEVLLNLAIKLNNLKCTDLRVQTIKDINDTLIWQLMGAYQKLTVFSRSHNVHHLYIREINSIVIFFHLLNLRYPDKYSKCLEAIQTSLTVEKLDIGKLTSTISQAELASNTYFGAYPSDDSDDEVTEGPKYSQLVSYHVEQIDGHAKIKKDYKFSVEPTGYSFIGYKTVQRAKVKTRVENPFQNTTSEALTLWFLRSQRSDLFNCINAKKPFAVSSSSLKILEGHFRDLIKRSFPRNENELKTINTAVKQGKKITFSPGGNILIDNVQLSNTKFFIPLFRGEAHLHDRWSQEGHRAHYYGPIVNFSEAVMNTAELGGFCGYQAFVDAQKNPTWYSGLLFNAKKLQKELITLRNSNPVAARINGKYKLFDNMLVFLQRTYSNGIERFLPLLAHLKKSTPRRAWDKIFPNRYNPFMSFSELPEHALRYAFGDKNPYSNFRRRPRWRLDGRAEHPHVGICYSPIFPLSEFVGPNYPNVLRQLRATGSAGLNLGVGPETEVSFLSFYDKKYATPEFGCQKLGVRFPSFHHENYQGYYYAKYGIDLSLYNLMKERVVGPKRWSNTELETILESSIYQWLKLFHGFNMLFKCYHYVYSKPNSQIIFLTESPGLFGFDLPNYIASLDTPEKNKRSNIANNFFTNRSVYNNIKIERVDGVYDKGLEFAEVPYKLLRKDLNLDGFIDELLARRKTLAGFTPKIETIIPMSRGAHTGIEVRHKLRSGRQIYINPADKFLEDTGLSDSSEMFSETEQSDSLSLSFNQSFSDLKIEADQSPLLRNSLTQQPISPIKFPTQMYVDTSTIRSNLDEIHKQFKQIASNPSVGDIDALQRLKSWIFQIHEKLLQAMANQSIKFEADNILKNYGDIWSGNFIENLIRQINMSIVD